MRNNLNKNGSFWEPDIQSLSKSIGLPFLTGAGGSRDGGAMGVVITFIV